MIHFQTHFRYHQDKHLTIFQEYWTENVALWAYIRSSKIWPGDLVFDPTWPSFKLMWDIFEANILIKFHEYLTENVACRANTTFFFFFFFSSRDLVFYPTWPTFKLIQDIIKANILTMFHEYRTENVASRVRECFCKIWPGDLAFDPTWPIFKHLQELIKVKYSQ